MMIVFVIEGAPVSGQVVLNRAAMDTLVAGESGTLSLTGRGFNSIEAIDSVRFGDYDIEVLGHEILSDEKAALSIRVPQRMKPDKYTVFIQVSGLTFTKTLRSQLGRGNGPKVALKFNGNKMTIPAKDAIHFGKTKIGEPVIRKFEVSNEGKETLEFGQFRADAGFALDGSFPSALEQNRSSLFYVKFTAENAGSFVGSLEFGTNDPDQDPVRIPVSGMVELLPVPQITVRADSELVDPSGGKHVSFVSKSPDAPGTKSIKIMNDETDDLLLDSVILPPGFRIDGIMPERIAAGEMDSLTIAFQPNSVVSIQDSVLIFFNNKQYRPFTFRIAGDVLADTLPALPDSVHEIAATTRPDSVAFDPFRRFEIKVDDQPVSPEMRNQLILTSDNPDIPASKTIYLFNGDSTDRSISLIIPEPFFSANPVPVKIAPGMVDSIIIGYQAGAGENHQGQIQLSINDALIVFDIAGMVRMPESEPVDYLPMLLIGLAVLVTGGIVFMAWPKLAKLIAGVKNSGSRKIKGLKPNVEFKISKDYGNPLIQFREKQEKKFEIRIKPVLDFGRAEIMPHKAGLINPRKMHCNKRRHLNRRTHPEQEKNSSNDLTKIEGIGPVIGKLLNEAGIVTFRQLADCNPADLRGILESAKIYYADPDTWPKQARLAAGDKWSVLASLQERLLGGRDITKINKIKKQKSKV